MDQDQEFFQVNFVLLNKKGLAASLVKGTTFKQVLDELKGMDNGLPNVDNEQFNLTNLSQGKTFQRIKLKNTVEQLGRGRLQVMIQLDKQLQQDKTKIQQTTLIFHYKGQQVQIEIANNQILKNVILQIKNELGLDPQTELIPTIGGAKIDSQQTVQITMKRYKNKVIQLIEQNLKQSSIPGPVEQPQQNLKIKVLIIDGQNKFETTLQNIDPSSSYQSIQKDIQNYTIMNHQWEYNESVKIFGHYDQNLDKTKQFSKMYPGLKTINIKVQRQFPGGY